MIVQDITTPLAFALSGVAAFLLLLVLISIRNKRGFHFFAALICGGFSVGYALILLGLPFDHSVWFRPLASPLFLLISAYAVGRYIKKESEILFNDIIDANNRITILLSDLKDLVEEGIAD